MRKEALNKILVVDDEQDVVKMIETFLFKRGFAVDTAFDGDKALEFIKNNRYSIIFLDYHMPGKTGLEVLDYIRKHHIITSVVMITGHRGMKEELAKFVGADEYLEKPLEIASIEQVIGKCLSLSKPMEDVDPDKF